MLVVRAVGIHKLQEYNASRTSHSGFIVDLSLFFFFNPLEGNKQHILLFRSTLICCKSSKSEA